MNLMKISNLLHFVKLTTYKPSLFSRHTCSAFNNTNIFLPTQIRNFSIQSSVASTIQTQSGFFQSISQSTAVEYVQKVLVSIHDQCGIPWWATIISTTVVLRSCITVPFAIYQQNILAKVENISSKMPDIAKELQKETAIAIKLYQWDERTAKYHYRKSLKKQWNKLIVQENCHPLKATVLLWFQIPLWISFSMALRNLVYVLPKKDLDAYVTYTELTLGGFGWIPNLTEVDSSYIFPIAMGLINLAIIELQNMSSLKPPTKFQKYISYFFKGVTVCIIPIAASVPSCLVLYWTTSSAYGLVQNLILMSPKVKRFCRIPKTSSEVSNPYVHVVNNLKNKYLKSSFF